MFAQIVILGIVFILSFIYSIGKYNENYWKKRGVKFYAKNKVMGIQWDFLAKDRAMFEVINDLYKQYPKEPALGLGSLFTPSLYVRDPKNVQCVLQSDFQSFNHRGIEQVNKEDLLADNLLFMNGNRWKLMRQHMTPLFTAAKLKDMYYILDKSAQDFVGFIKEDPGKFKGDTFSMLNSFCSAAIAAAVFGIHTNSIFDSPFLKMARDAMALNLKQNLKFALMNLSMPLAKALGINIFKDHQEFFVGAIKQVIRQREKDNVNKHDFADICVNLQKNGKMRDPETGLELVPTDEILAAQAFFYFLAGVEPSATAIYGTFIELGRNPEILEKVHREIDETFEKYNGKLTYDAVTEMEYLEKVLSEALRMYPPIGFLTRKCVRDTVLPVGNIRVQKGTNIFSPVFEMHHDPELYPNPEIFDPERFSEDSKGGDFTYQPFGKGGRICIGMRYARLQVKAGIIYLLRNFTVSTVVKGNTIEYCKMPFQVRPKNVDMELILRKVEK